MYPAAAYGRTPTGLTCSMDRSRLGPARPSPARAPSKVSRKHLTDDQNAVETLPSNMLAAKRRATSILQSSLQIIVESLHGPTLLTRTLGPGSQTGDLSPTS
jgi:hypothetical protein